MLTKATQLYAGQLSEDDSARMETYFYDLPGAQKRRNAYIYQPTDELVIESLPELLAKAKLSHAGTRMTRARATTSPWLATPGGSR